MHTLTAIPQPVSAARTLRGTVVHCPGRSQRAAAAALRLLGLRPLRFLGTPGRWACIVSARPGALVPPYLPQPAPAARPAPAAARTPGHPMPAAASSSALPSFAAAWITILLSLSLSLFVISKADGATVVSNLTQGATNVDITNFITNNDNAIYDSATFDLVSTYQPILQAIKDNKLGVDATYGQPYNTLGLNQIADNIGITIRGGTTGEVRTGWTSAYDIATGKVSLTHGPGTPDLNYAEWQSTQSNPAQDMMALTFNFGNMLDFNSNGAIDANEALVQNGYLTNGFEGYINFNNQRYADTPMYQLNIPEPSTTGLLGLGLAGALLYRRREPRSVFPCVTSREGKRAA